MASTDPSGAMQSVVNTVSDAATDIFNSVSDTVNSVSNTVSNVPFLNSLVSNSGTSGAANANKPANNAKPANNGNSMFSFMNTNANKPANNANKPANNANKPANNANKPANNANKPANNFFSFSNNTNANKPANNAKPANSSNKPANTSSMFETASNVLNNIANVKSNSSNSSNSSSYGSYALYIFFALVLTFVVLFSVFNAQIKQGYEYIEANIRKFMDMSVPPDVNASVSPTVNDTPVTAPPEAPQDITPNEASVYDTPQQNIVEKILPPSGQEVFNVSQNKFTYYDAEPLCNALGAELATYEQVKDAWSAGADWCNYGWVKGQMAVYPTQKQTYDKLQMGPADQRGACGTVGVNGGYFDNPEFKYGVNCFGKKPGQSAHDEAMLMSQGKAPKTPATLKIDALEAEYKEQADSLFVRPFNDKKWLSS